MHLSDFDYHLPPERIAQTPAEPRDSARLLCLDKVSWDLENKVFSDIANMLWENDVLVVNSTHVIKARLRWNILQSLSFCEGKDSGMDSKSQSKKLWKPCEIFLHKQISDNTWDCLVYPGKKLKPGTQVIFYGNSHSKPHSWIPHPLLEERSWGEVLTATIISNSQKWRIIEFSKSGQELINAIDVIGETPLPPYIKDSTVSDSRYQTVYHEQEKSGSVAAPTAGLHFTPELLKRLEKKWIKIEKVLLHVGLGTFANVEVENIQDHHMHSEYAEIDPETSKRLNQYKSEGKRIIAVGTTSVRTLESFSDQDGHLWYGSLNTEIFIYPWYQWKFVNSIITNFHLPKSTLVMLVSSFAGSENIKKAYQHAIDSGYRFFSFWDAMWIK